MYKGLHVLDAPLVTLRSGSSASVLLLEVLFLEPISTIYNTYLAMMSKCRNEKPSTHRRRPTYIQA